METGSEPPVTSIPETDPEKAGQGLHSLRWEWRRRPGRGGGVGRARQAFPAPEPPRGPLLWPPSLLSPVPLVRTTLRYITGTLNPGTPGLGELLISPLTYR